MNELREILNYTYQKRQSMNAHYSQNAFARDLHVSPTALSQFLSGKRCLSRLNIDRVASALYLSSALIDQMKGKRNDLSPSVKLKMDIFSLIADWYHYGILNLTETSEIKSTLQISERLGIANETAIKAVQRLTSLGFLKIENGTMRRTQAALDAGTDVPSEALRKHNREKLELAILALEKFTIHERDISSVTIAFDPDAMEAVKKEIQKFKKKIISICETAKSVEVFSLNVQFFPLSKKECVE
jgi:uncharacterized protein (TIGR02147 family)